MSLGYVMRDTILRPVAGQAAVNCGGYCSACIVALLWRYCGAALPASRDGSRDVRFSRHPHCQQWAITTIQTEMIHSSFDLLACRPMTKL